ncbi:hypothetical protein NKJ46_02200 [Mesorhizobium sp. M0166]|uniref:hypothetical protein n=1 Tax=unclassified Mesorhizobium TaxID=325217 RepID=UPI00333DC26C
MRQKALLAIDKNGGDNLPEWLPSRLPEDPVIRADVAAKISSEAHGKNGSDDEVLMKARLVEQEEAEA